MPDVIVNGQIGLWMEVRLDEKTASKYVKEIKSLLQLREEPSKLLATNKNKTAR